MSDAPLLSQTRRRESGAAFWLTLVRIRLNLFRMNRLHRRFDRLFAAEQFAEGNIILARLHVLDLETGLLFSRIDGEQEAGPA